MAPRKGDATVIAGCITTLRAIARVAVPSNNVSLNVGDVEHGSQGGEDEYDGGSGEHLNFGGSSQEPELEGRWITP